MRTARLDDVGELRALMFERVGELLDLRNQQAELDRGSNADGGRKDIVGRLRHVDVIVGIDRLVLAGFSAQGAVRDVRDHLIAVHVERSAGASLKNVYWKLITVFTLIIEELIT